ncbi:CBS domain-containing protein [Candidatus Nitronereus thalassa]|uniref:CBS domain-containing protein n=1 Tax=Candidatus Nitronereus thalassa TaxID=3020898 RepID=A0ABU3K3I2_9BACT|nr:CBS domain-containing protein [Candidatus Nitronereus thalassa]MDT7040941.1 CBS domain-containing protein [Candidatus Nitronereus thalassa]
MTEPVHCVGPEVTLAELRGIFKRVRYHHILVAQDNQLLGVISDRDVLRMSSPFLDTTDATAHDQSLLDNHAQTIMSTTLITAKKDTLIDAAAILLLEHNISCLPVVSTNGDIEGILTWKDMLKYYVYVR